MDIFEIRLANLNALVADMKRRGITKQKDQALAMNLSPSHLSQHVGGKKMGEDVARKIEAACQLPSGWFDSIQSAARVAESSADYGAASHFMKIDPPTIAAATRLVRLTFRNLDVDFDNEQDGVPLALAYQYLLARQQRVVTPDNLVDFSKKLAEKLRESEDARRSEGAGAVSEGNRGQGEARRGKAK